MELDHTVDADEQLTPAESHAWRRWARHLPSPRRKRKKRRKRRPSRTAALSRDDARSMTPARQLSPGSFAGCRGVRLEIWTTFYDPLCSGSLCSVSGCRLVRRWIHVHTSVPEALGQFPTFQGEGGPRILRFRVLFFHALFAPGKLDIIIRALVSCSSFGVCVA